MTRQCCFVISNIGKMMMKSRKKKENFFFFFFETHKKRKKCIACVIYLEFFASCSVAEHHPQGTAGIEPRDGALTASQVDGPHSPRMITACPSAIDGHRHLVVAVTWRWIAFQTTAITKRKEKKNNQSIGFLEREKQIPKYEHATPRYSRLNHFL